MIFPLDGVLCLDKPTGLSSFAAVKEVRTALGARRAGHTGTLDPAANGLLVVALGRATRIIPFLETGRKRYLAEIRLGVATDTQDSEGRVTEERSVPALPPEAVEAVLPRFCGEIEQIPPMYSALHRNGKRLYQLARDGQQVERPPRRVRIEEIKLTGCEEGRLRLEVVCGPGTYIRTLAADLASALGTVGHLGSLRRLETCGFDLGQAVALWAGREELARAVLPLEKVLERFPRLQLSSEQARLLLAGNFIQAPPLEQPAGTLFWVAAGGAHLLARLVSRQGRLVLKPERMLAAGAQ